DRPRGLPRERPRGAQQVLRRSAGLNREGRAAAGRPGHAHRGGAGRGSRRDSRRQAVAGEVQRREPRRRLLPGRDRQRRPPALPGRSGGEQPRRLRGGNRRLATPGRKGLREHRPRAPRRRRDVGERRERNYMGAQHRLLAPGRRAGAQRLLQRRLPGLDPGRDPGSGAAGVPRRDRSDRGHRVGACTSGGSTMPFSTIATPEAKPVANYKMATRMEGGRLLYISGQVAWDATGNIVGKGDVRAQARQVFENLRGVLRAAGGDLPSLMKITTYITKLEDFPAV